MGQIRASDNLAREREEITEPPTRLNRSIMLNGLLGASSFRYLIGTFVLTL